MTWAILSMSVRGFAGRSPGVTTLKTESPFAEAFVSIESISAGGSTSELVELTSPSAGASVSAAGVADSSAGAAVSGSSLRPDDSLPASSL